MKISLENLKNFLNKYDFQTTEQAASETLPYDQLFVFLGEDEQERPWVLNLRIFDQNAVEAGKEAGKETGINMLFLNFFIALPFSVQTETFPDISRLILLVNKLLPLPGFCLSEIDKLVYYHYTYPSLNGEIDPETILTLIGIIIHLLNTHMETFEKVGRKEKTLGQIFSEAKQFVQSLKPETSN